ncbi:2'-5' RNA ligase family protein [Pengzhenrongella sp.]|jgi:hypothetical protein|uniref:2'-5' RNA ligase family protein n=1 Tax=Pengzhenrongella sp. TaxID=2888820 RepID=UPI002F91EF3A
MTHASIGAPGDPYRYGVYLRPDPRTCQAVTTVTDQLRAQYGLISAGAFPPHATLIGSQHVAGAEADLVEAVTKALDGFVPFTVHNAGVRAQGVGLVYDVHHLADGRTVNEDLMNLAATVDGAAAPMVTSAANPEPHRFDSTTFHGHLSLASHDLYARADLRDEVEEYVRGLSAPHPASFAGDTVTMYRTRSDDWTGRWWQTLTWTHVHTWRLDS